MAKPDKQSAADRLQHMEQTLQDTNLPPEKRAELAAFYVHEQGLDAVPAIASVIRTADEAQALRAKVNESEGNPLALEIFLAVEVRDGRTYAVVTRVGDDLRLPAQAEEVEGLEFGDPVLVDTKSGRLAGRDGELPCPGDVTSVVERVKGERNIVLVKHHEQVVQARVPESLCRDAPLPIGARVIYDPARRFIRRRLEGGSDGHELLTPLEQLDQVSRDKLGAAHPVLDEILFLIQRWVLHPDWMQRMQARAVNSYLFAGSTGTGKSFHLKVLAKEVSDFIYQQTGQRLSRLVMVDASTFYSSLFGETENKINSFFDRLATLGKTPLVGRDGRPVAAPLIVVLEEAEALFRARGEVGGSAHLFDRPLALMLQRLSSVSGELGVPATFIATTNRADLIDPAALRRIGMRAVTFGSLSAGQAASVLDKKLDARLKFRDADRFADVETARQVMINIVLSYLYGNDPDQGIAEVRMQDGQRRTIRRSDLVTGAQLEEAVSRAIDECLRQSDAVDDLLGIDAESIVRALQAQYTSLATLFRPHNLPEHLPQWFAGEPLRVESVRPLRPARRPRALLFN